VRRNARDQAEFFEVTKRHADAQPSLDLFGSAGVQDQHSGRICCCLLSELAGRRTFAVKAAVFATTGVQDQDSGPNLIYELAGRVLVQSRPLSLPPPVRVYHFVGLCVPSSVYENIR